MGYKTLKKYTVAIIAITIAIVCLTSPVHAFFFDKEAGNLKLPEDPGMSYVKITTFGSALGLAWDYEEKTWETKTTAFLIQGVGFVVNEKYIITAAHVVEPLIVRTYIKSGYCYVMRPVRVLSKTTVVTSETGLTEIAGGKIAKIYHCDINHDIAVLEYESCFFEPIAYPLSATRYPPIDIFARPASKLKEGDAIAMIVRVRDEQGDWDWGFEIRHGKVISPSVVADIKEAYSEEHFSASIEIYPGDSGSPVFAFKDGEPVVVGVVTSTDPQIFRGKAKRGYITRVDFVKMIINPEKNIYEHY